MIRKLFILKLFTGFLIYSQPAFAGNGSSLEKAEDSLKRITASFPGSASDSARAQTNSLFLATLRSTLDLPGSFDYPFDSLKTLGKITSPDRKVRFYNWNLPLRDGTNRYFCLLQVKKDEHNAFDVWSLTDASDSLESPESQVLSASRWYGVLYYKVILNTGSDGKPVYTLLGWDGISPILTSKLIEVLTFDPDRQPRFGAQIFTDYENGQYRRVILTYSSEARMTMKYDELSVKKGSKIQDLLKRSGIHQDKIDMIVFDRLVPLEPQLEGLRQYYVPSADIYDGFVFLNNSWHFIREVDARNNPVSIQKRH